MLITLSPPDRTFYLPPSRLSRSPSPSAGYTSDTEVGARKVNETADDVSVGLGITVPTVFDREQRHPPDRTEEPEENLPTSPSGWSITARKSRRRTAGWQELLKYVTRPLRTSYDDWAILRIFLTISHITFLTLRNGKRGWLTVCCVLHVLRFLEQISHVAERYSGYERIA